MIKQYSILLLFFFVSVEASLAGSPCDNLQVTELSSGQALLFGVEIKLEDLSAAIEVVSQNNGAIFYFRENESERQSTMSRKIIELAIKNQVPIRMSKESDFSDVLYKYGNAK